MSSSPTPTAVLIAVGDLMFYGPMAEAMRASGDPLWGFRPLGRALLEGDLLFGNFETPISARAENEPDAPAAYFAPPGGGAALAEYGFDLVNLAHNHIYDFGAEGVECTLAELDRAGLPHVGIGRTPEEASAPVIVRAASGVSFGFLGYTTANTALDPKHDYVACFPDEERVAVQVAELAEKADVVVVSCHCGAQYNPYPAPETRRLARTAIQAGASVFLGHHPHVPQGIERIATGLAVYSLGDFVAPVHTDQTRRTFFVRTHLAGRAVEYYDVVPCFITDDCQTALAEGKLGEEIAGHIRELSSAIAAGASDDLHFRTARKRFFSQYVRSWIEELRFGGPKVLWRKLRNLRGYHLQLVVRILAGKLLFWRR